MTTPTKDTSSSERGNVRVVFMCLFMVFGMVGMAYAAVPLYDLFCRVTGYGGTTQVAENSYGIQIVDRDITVRFDANTAPGLAWNFAPEQRSVELKLGEQRLVNYYIENNTDEVLTGTATFNVTPQSAGALFNKIECFCFTDTRVEPGERLEMPVVFFVDPDLLEAKETAGVQTITLSYTFFPTPGADDTASLEDTNANEAAGG